MDTFKLLSKSTNLQKFRPAPRKSSTQHVPSDGDIRKSPGILPVSDYFDIEPVSEQRSAIKRGIKRKRGKDEGTENFGNSLDPEFVDEGMGDVLVSQELWQPTVQVPTDEPRYQVERSSSQTMPSMISEGDCKKILKFHKVKVTLVTADIQRSARLQKELKSLTGGTVQTSKSKPTFAQLLPQPLTSFAQLRSKYGISKRLAENIAIQGYKMPTEVQLGGIPLLLGSDRDRGLPSPGNKEEKKTGKKTAVDLLAVAPTGTGKTLAFLIPIIQGLLLQRYSERDDRIEESRDVRAIVIAPTHELADQILNEAKKLTIGTGVRVSGVRKGMKLNKKTTVERDRSKNSIGADSGCHDESERRIIPGKSLSRTDIVISTPLTLLHAISEPDTSVPIFLPSVHYLVLDEADVLLDLLFRNQTLSIWQACINPSLQTSLWSATIGASIESLAITYISERRRKLRLGSANHGLIRLITGLKDSALPTISHRLVYAATEQGKLLALRQLLHPSTSNSSDQSQPMRPPFLIFTQTISRAIALHSELLYDISPEAGGFGRIAVLHSDLSETTRFNIMARFRTGEIWVLITTDLLSRGVDFKGINGVVNYDIPNTGVAYIHRAGRTGRAGREGGMAITFYTKEDIPYVKNIANVIATTQKSQARSGHINNEDGVQRWLLDALPAVSKKSKKDLKQHGVGVRRTHGTGKEVKSMRISTKSGYDRRLENNRRRVDGPRRVPLQDSSHGVLKDDDDDMGDEEWFGIQEH
ncbi:RNA-dependent ATPase rok1 [Schaereria dolodes]|nr:RNA-dependent ATPase rok1 [Schaereria dolodes]